MITTEFVIEYEKHFEWFWQGCRPFGNPSRSSRIRVPSSGTPPFGTCDPGIDGQV
jgi:hypothetical protein